MERARDQPAIWGGGPAPQHLFPCLGDCITCHTNPGPFASKRDTSTNDFGMACENQNRPRKSEHVVTPLFAAPAAALFTWDLLVGQWLRHLAVEADETWVPTPVFPYWWEVTPLSMPPVLQL